MICLIQIDIKYLSWHHLTVQTQDELSISIFAEDYQQQVGPQLEIHLTFLMVIPGNQVFCQPLASYHRSRCQIRHSIHFIMIRIYADCNKCPTFECLCTINFLPEAKFIIMNTIFLIIAIRFAFIVSFQVIYTPGGPH